jgi:hypothetical protein
VIESTTLPITVKMSQSSDKITELTQTSIVILHTHADVPVCNTCLLSLCLPHPVPTSAPLILPFSLLCLNLDPSLPRHTGRKREMIRPRGPQVYWVTWGHWTWKEASSLFWWSELPTSIYHTAQRQKDRVRKRLMLLTVLWPCSSDLCISVLIS